MASIKFRLRSKSNKNVSIKIYLSTGRENKFIETNTGFSINPKDWSDKDLPKQNNAENRVLFNQLKKLETFVFDQLNNDSAIGTLIDLDWLKSKIDNCFGRVVKVDTGLISNHIQFIIDNANTERFRAKKL